VSFSAVATFDGGHDCAVAACTVVDDAADVVVGTVNVMRSAAADEGDDPVAVEHVTSVPQTISWFAPLAVFGSESALADPWTAPWVVVTPLVVTSACAKVKAARLCTTCSCWMLAFADPRLSSPRSNSVLLIPTGDAVVGTIEIVPAGAVALP
jgi:hypothetical protein